MTGRMQCLDPDLVAAMRRPAADAAKRLYEPLRRRMGWPYPIDATPEVTALACIHRTRIRWAGATKAMVRESKAWLIAHGMSPDPHHAADTRLQ